MESGPYLCYGGGLYEVGVVGISGVFKAVESAWGNHCVTFLPFFQVLRFLVYKPLYVDELYLNSQLALLLVVLHAFICFYPFLLKPRQYNVSEPLKMLRKIERVSSLWRRSVVYFLLIDIQLYLVILCTYLVRIQFYLLYFVQIYLFSLYMKMGLAKISLDWFVNGVLYFEQLPILFGLNTLHLLKLIHIDPFVEVFLRSGLFRWWVVKAITLTHEILLWIVGIGVLVVLVHELSELLQCVIRWCWI